MSVTGKKCHDMKSWFESGCWLEFTQARGKEEAGGEEASTAHYLSSLSGDLLHHGHRRRRGVCVFYCAAGYVYVFMCVDLCCKMLPHAVTFGLSSVCVALHYPSAAFITMISFLLDNDNYYNIIQNIISFHFNLIAFKQIHYMKNSLKPK